MLEVEQASINSEAQARLAQIRSQLGSRPRPSPPRWSPAPTDAAAPADGGTAAPGA